MSQELKRRIERLEAMFPPLDPEGFVAILDARNQTIRVENRRGEFIKNVTGPFSNRGGLNA